MATPNQSQKLTPAELRKLRALLEHQRAEIAEQLARLNTAMTGVRDARVGLDADDEHDPEGPTLVFEWSRIAGLQAESTKDLAGIDRARERMNSGDYGLCRKCGRPISLARLEARPAAELCIECARALDASH
ncbi:MAG: TraR/DksA C4-type zinc finger protein [Microbacteriaceae bacterium]